jgi:hypothetical protein
LRKKLGNKTSVLPLEQRDMVLPISSYHCFCMADDSLSLALYVGESIDSIALRACDGGILYTYDNGYQFGFVGGGFVVLSVFAGGLRRCVVREKAKNSVGFFKRERLFDLWEQSEGIG